jgi:hypothetical protein
MASYRTVEDWQTVAEGYVVAVTIRQTTDAQYPSGWNYSLHLGEVGDETILRYDNAHERTIGHERHTRDCVEEIEFPGMGALYERFKRDVERRTSISWHDAGSQSRDQS